MVTARPMHSTGAELEGFEVLLLAPLHCRHLFGHQGKVVLSCELPKSTIVTAELKLFHP